MAKLKFPHYWICGACATKKGGVWPKGHVATLADMMCKYCKGKQQVEAFIAPWVDYNWPADEAKNRDAKQGRD